MSVGRERRKGRFPWFPMHCVEGEKLKILDAYTMFPCGKKPDYFEKTVRIWLRIETLDLLIAKKTVKKHITCLAHLT